MIQLPGPATEVIIYLKRKDITGYKFGKLTAIERCETLIDNSGRARSCWKCLCDCGEMTVVRLDGLMSGRSTSCGCVAKQMLSERQKTHGESGTKLYGVWCSMKSRCNNPNDAHFADYGGRGIFVCDEWVSDYAAFKNWAFANGYAEGLSIDRIDNMDGYHPDNCRWVAGDVQANNRRSNRIYTINNESHNLTDWARIRGINPKTLFTRIYSGMSFEEAITR